MGEVTRSRSQGCQVEEGGAGFGSLHPRVRCLIEQCGRCSPETVTSPGPPGEQGGAWAPDLPPPSPGPSTTPSHEAPAFLAHRILWTRNRSPAEARLPAGSAEGLALPDLRSAGLGRGAPAGRGGGGLGPLGRGTMPGRGTVEGGREEGTLTPAHGASRVRGPGKKLGLLGLRTRFSVTPPRVHSGPREPWQRGLYGGRTGPGAAAFPELARSREQRLRDERSPLPAPCPLPRPHPAFPGRVPFPHIVWTV